MASKRPVMEQAAAGPPQKRAMQMLNIEVVKVNGESVAKLRVGSSSRVQGVLERLNRAAPFGNREGQLTYGTAQLLPHESLCDAGVQDGAVLSLTFEAKPVPLRSVRSRLTTTQVRSEEARLQRELTRRQGAVAAATAALEESQRARQTSTPPRPELLEVQSRVQEADRAVERAANRLADAQAAMRRGEEELRELRQRQEVRDVDLVLERLRRDPWFLSEVVGDLKRLHEAGQATDEELRGAAEIVAGAGSVIDKADCLCILMQGLDPAVEPGVGLLRRLLPDAPAFAAAVARCYKHAAYGEYQSIAYAAMLVLRRAGLAAAGTIEREIQQKLLEARVVDWGSLAEDIGRAEDASMAETFAEGLIALARRSPGQHRATLKSAVKSFEAAALPAADRLREALAELGPP